VRSFDVIKARRAVAEMRVIGAKAAAKKHKVTERTLWNWQRRLRELADEATKDGKREAAGAAEVVSKALEGAGGYWRRKLRAALGVGLDRLALIAVQETDPDKLSRALERLAEVEVTAEALGVGTASAGEGGEPSSDEKAP
jgi:hypothetical protein